MRPRSFRLSALAVAFASVTLVACGDDDDDATATDDDTAAVTDDTGSENNDDAAEGTDDAAEGTDEDAVVVTLADYEFRDLPDTVPAGTQLSVVNIADAELHELVAFRLPDDEERDIADLVSLPPDEFGPFMGSLGHPDAVLLATPGGPQIPAVGDGTLTEPGRYAIFCMIPIGVEPEVYLQAAQESDGEAPQVDGAGPPHITAGMYAELIVE